MVHFSFADVYVFGSREGKKLAWHPDFSGMVKDEDKYMGKEGGGGGERLGPIFNLHFTASSEALRQQRRELIFIHSSPGNPTHNHVFRPSARSRLAPVSSFSWVGRTSVWLQVQYDATFVLDDISCFKS